MGVKPIEQFPGSNENEKVPIDDAKGKKSYQPMAEAMGDSREKEEEERKKDSKEADKLLASLDSRNAANETFKKMRGNPDYLHSMPKEEFDAFKSYLAAMIGINGDEVETMSYNIDADLYWVRLHFKSGGTLIIDLKNGVARGYMARMGDDKDIKVPFDSPHVKEVVEKGGELFDYVKEGEGLILEEDRERHCNANLWDAFYKVSSDYKGSKLELKVDGGNKSTGYDVYQLYIDGQRTGGYVVDLTTNDKAESSEKDILFGFRLGESTFYPKSVNTFEAELRKKLDQTK